VCKIDFCQPFRREKILKIISILGEIPGLNGRFAHIVCMQKLQTAKRCLWPYVSRGS